jgi:putative membrane protein
MMHPGEDHHLEIPSAAGWDVVMVLVLSAAATVYLTGVWRLWARAGVGHGVRRWHVACYSAGMMFLWLALISPLDALADVRFSAHMSQHELLMLVGAPLIVLGKPFVAGAWVLDDGARERWLAWVRRSHLRAGWRVATHPLLVLAVHGAVLWIWHIPALFEAALAHPGLHAVQHAMFFGTAMLFWWALIDGRYGRAGYGVSVAYVFATAMHSGFLGVLATLARHTWYPTHAERTAAAGADALVDQQLAGLIMWVPAGVILTAIGLALFVAWLGEAERRVARGVFREGGQDA